MTFSSFFSVSNPISTIHFPVSGSWRDEFKTTKLMNIITDWKLSDTVWWHDLRWAEMFCGHHKCNLVMKNLQGVSHLLVTHTSVQCYSYYISPCSIKLFSRYRHIDPTYLIKISSLDWNIHLNSFYWFQQPLIIEYLKQNISSKLCFKSQMIYYHESYKIIVVQNRLSDDGLSYQHLTPTINVIFITWYHKSLSVE